MDSQDITYENFENFLAKAQQFSQGGVIDMKATSFTKISKYGMSKVCFQKQLKINQLMDSLRKELFVNILYLAKSPDNKTWKATAYSMPYSDELYVIQMQSQIYGIIKQMDVIFYNSLDDMFNQVNQEYQGLQEGQLEILEMERPENLYINFIN